MSLRRGRTQRKKPIRAFRFALTLRAHNCVTERQVREFVRDAILLHASACDTPDSIRRYGCLALAGPCPVVVRPQEAPEPAR